MTPSQFLDILAALKHHFCTLFDSNYLSRGLTMYESLKKTGSEFHLYVFPFDAHCAQVLTELELENVTIVSMQDFEDPELLKAKPTRTTVEYCWTCTASTIAYCLEKFNLPRCTYLDADLYFFSDPSVLINEMGDKDVLITEHRFSPRYSSYIENGIYNVQLVSFRNSPNGRHIVHWWRDRCIEWCYFRAEDGKLGDQKYLDDWTTRFQGVHVLKNEGGALGPWNIQTYSVNVEGRKTTVTNLSTEQKFEAIFFHFHNFKISENGYAKAISYELGEGAIKYLYQPYLKELLGTYKSLVARSPALRGKGFLTQEDQPSQIRSCLNRGNFDGDNFIIYDSEKFKIFERSAPKEKISPKIYRCLRSFKKFLKPFIKWRIQ